MGAFVWVLFRDVNVMESGPQMNHSGQGCAGLDGLIPPPLVDSCNYEGPWQLWKYTV